MAFSNHNLEAMVGYSRLCQMNGQIDPGMIMIALDYWVHASENLNLAIQRLREIQKTVSKNGQLVIGETGGQGEKT